MLNTDREAGRRAAPADPGERAPGPQRVEPPPEWLERVRLLESEVSEILPAASPEIANRRIAEQYRMVRTKILQNPRHASVIVVSSPCVGDGKSVSATNLAAALALRSDNRVLLLDADLRRSSVHERLKTAVSPGLSEILAGECQLQEALRRAPDLPQLYVLAAGEPRGNPTELLDSSAWRLLLPALRQWFRYIVVDCPPVEAVADYDLVADSSDGVILVVRPDHTHRGLCLRALKSIQDKLLGVIINDAPEWLLWRHHPSQHYTYAPDVRSRKGR